MTGNNELFCLVQVFLGLQIRLEFHTVLALDLSCFFYISTKVSTPLLHLADDTSLYIIVDDPTQVADQLNSGLVKIHRWADKWLVAFKPEKSGFILLSRKYNKTFHPPVLMNQMAEVNSHKHVGVICSNDCTCHEYRELVQFKA